MRTGLVWALHLLPQKHADLGGETKVIVHRQCCSAALQARLKGDWTGAVFSSLSAQVSPECGRHLENKWFLYWFSRYCDQHLTSTSKGKKSWVWLTVLGFHGGAVWGGRIETAGHIVSTERGEPECWPSDGFALFIPSPWNDATHIS